MPSITPTVGRKVWYRPDEKDLAGGPSGVPMTLYHDDPLDATVVAVLDKQTVNLSIIDAAGVHFYRPNVYLHGDDDILDHEDRPYAEWMPFQRSQATQVAQEVADFASKTAPIPELAT